MKRIFNCWNSLLEINLRSDAVELLDKHLNLKRSSNMPKKFIGGTPNHKNDNGNDHRYNRGNDRTPAQKAGDRKKQGSK